MTFYLSLGALDDVNCTVKLDIFPDHPIFYHSLLLFLSYLL